MTRVRVLGADQKRKADSGNEIVGSSEEFSLLKNHDVNVMKAYLHRIAKTIARRRNKVFAIFVLFSKTAPAVNEYCCPRKNCVHPPEQGHPTRILSSEPLKHSIVKRFLVFKR